jgi:hypothetical protein
LTDETKKKISQKQKQHQSTLTKQQRANNVRKAQDAAKQKNIEKYSYNSVDNIFLLQGHSWNNIMPAARKKNCIPRFKYEEYKNKGFLKEVLDYISQEVKYTNPIIENDRKTLNPLELGINIPDKGLAIEYHGLYWCSEKYREKQSHFKKFQLCQEKNIQLLQIYEDEWREKGNIWKSIISLKLGHVEHKYNARKLTLQEDASLAEFLNLNHLQGDVRCQKSFSLHLPDGSPVFCITLRRPFTKGKSDCMEIARVCSLQGTVVRGGLSKLMKRVEQWCKDNNYKKVLTYSDCRYSSGQAYLKYGFNLVKHTGAGYDYTDGIDRFFRFKFRAQPGKTEKTVAEENCVYKIYNAGNYLWELSIQ